MQLLVVTDTTTLSYWLNWSVLLCAIWVFTPMLIAFFLIWKYEYSSRSKFDREGAQQGRAWFLYAYEAWMPCVKQIHPLYLMAFRIIAFCLLLGAITVDVVVDGTDLFFYYTQWTFTLVTIYFGFGSLLSIYGCFQHHKISGSADQVALDAEKGVYVPLACGETANGVKKTNDFDHQGKVYVLQSASIWGYAFQIMFQMTAGAVMLTDIVYWCVIVPFLNIKDYEMSFLTVVAHSLNAIMLFGDTALNCLRFPWFGISYFILLTGIYVVFQWLVHACVSMWWPYPFLDLSIPYAPLWYLVVALMHIPCYGIFVLIMELKHYLLSRWCPQSYQCVR